MIKIRGKTRISTYSCIFPNGREIKSVAKKLNIAPQYIEKWDGGIDNGFAYLVHRTPKANDDYQYAPNEVIANFDYVGWIGEYEAKKQEKVKNIPYGNNDINNYLDCLYIGILSREDVEKRLSGSQYAKYHKKIPPAKIILTGWHFYFNNLLFTYKHPLRLLLQRKQILVNTSH